MVEDCPAFLSEIALAFRMTGCASLLSTEVADILVRPMITVMGTRALIEVTTGFLL